MIIIFQRKIKRDRPKIMYSFNENKNEDEETEQEQSFAMSLNETSQDILSIVVRICGLTLLFIGMWIAIQVFNEAISLYRDPGNIERMAKAIEDGSNIDKSIAPIRDSILSEDGEEATQKQDTSKDGFPFILFCCLGSRALITFITRTYRSHGRKNRG